MKTIITVTICVGLLVASGCANYDWSAFGRALGEYGQQQQEIANQRNAQLRENARDINQQLQRNAELNRQRESNRQQTYWQERRAQQEYQENWRKQHQTFPTVPR